MSAKETAYNAIKKLVDKFGDQIENYKSNSYNETLTRRDFIDPFFEALGWDINNNQDVWESYREVIHEDRIKIGGVMTAPDYSFRLQGGNRLFFVEAKKPMISIKDDVNPAYQIRLYGYNAKLSVSIVTDFEEFAVYDCSKKPKKTDKPSVARIEYFKYTDYLEKFDFLWDTFGRDQVIKGGLVKYARAEKKGTATVDKDFLQSLDEWRTLLAANIYKNNTLTEDELNYAVQQTIDRLIFLRFAEDRGIEPYGNLKGCLNQANHYVDLFRLFNLADQRYNSGLFHFNKERENSAPEDTITGKLIIDNKTVRSIITGLYENDYLFNVIPVEILGSAYEQFLGKQISIKGSKAVIEDKPEVRKAGGVYYTPQYIVDYIVQQTIGKLCDGKTPAQVSKLKIVDPACGSGSFLLGAYQYLLNWHLDYYKQEGENPKKKSKVLTPEGNLTTQEKKRILLNNIYGVDIDSNAVEVTKLSLLLKCMEGETPASVGTQMTIVHERVLPSLENNIKSGNSLIDLDYYDAEIDFGGEKKIKPFNWQQNFPEVFKQGGFDAVIGNPPYGATLTKSEIEYLNSRYYQTKKFPDSYCLFIVKAKYLLKGKGKLGFIVPNTFCDIENCDTFREWLLTETSLIEIYQTGWAFKDAVVDTLVFILENESSKPTDRIFVTVEGKQYSMGVKDLRSNYLFKIDYRNSPEDKEILNKVNKLTTLDGYIVAKAGVKLYEKGKGTPPQTDSTLKERPFTSEIQNAGWVELLRGGDISRYAIKRGNEYVNYGEWLAAPRNMELFVGDKILMRRTDDKLKSCIDKNGSISVNSCHVIKLNSEGLKCLTYEYLLGLLNSKFLQKIFELQNPQMVGKVFSEIKVVYVSRLPIITIDFENQKEKNQHDEIVKLVNQMLQLNEELQQATLPAQQEQLKQRIQYTDNKINQLVYQLYNLTEEEIRIVEGN